jgi:hypothetical protein
MRRELLDRLEKLEQRQQNKYVPPPPIPLSMFLIAYFDGGWQPGESAADPVPISEVGSVTTKRRLSLALLPRRQ